MIDELRVAISELLEGRDLTAETMHSAVGAIMDGRSTEVEIAALLTALRCRGESISELVGAARAMRERPRVAEGLKFLILLTKSDKLNKTEGAKALQIAKLNAGGGDVMLFSALKKQGIEQVAQHLWDWAHPIDKPAKKVKLATEANADETTQMIGEPVPDAVDTNHE